LGNKIKTEVVYSKTGAVYQENSPFDQPVKNLALKQSSGILKPEQRKADT